MRNAGLEEAQAGIKIAERNINNLRYADDTTLMTERYLCDLMSYSLPGFSIHGIFQAGILELYTAISFSKGSSQPRGQILCFLHWQLSYREALRTEFQPPPQHSYVRTLSPMTSGCVWRQSL